MINVSIYESFNRCAFWIVVWIAACTVITTVRIAMKVIRKQTKVGHSSFMTELPAIPLLLAQTICFGRALVSGDWFSALLFLWWGPGFWATVIYLIVCKKRGREPNWIPYRKTISWLCKLNYVAFIAVFLWLGFPALMFVYSAWILNDQYGMAFLSLDADRLRRTFHDRWIVRLAYPAGLVLPFLHPAMPSHLFYPIYGALLLGLWIAGVIYVIRTTPWLHVPDDPTLLRNMMYFGKPQPPP